MSARPLRAPCVAVKYSATDSPSRYEEMIGRGMISVDTLNSIHAKMHRAAASAGGRIDAVFFCPHAPGEGCDCRKPSPGLLLEITRRYGLPAQKLIMAGDSRRDLEAVAAVGGLPILVRTGNGAKAEAAGGLPPNTLIFDDLAAVSAYLLAREADKGQAPQ